MMPQWIKPAILGAMIGSVGLAIVGFTQLGWVTGTTAERMAQKSADAAVVRALVPICVARAQMDPEMEPLLQQLGGMTSKWDRRAFVVKAGWANMPGSEISNVELAEACAQALKDQAA